MSKYLSLQTVITDEAFLCDALKQMGYSQRVHKQPVTLTDYHDGKQLAHVVIPASQLGQDLRGQAHMNESWGDIGFFRQADGSYRAIIDEYDQDGIAGRLKYDDVWLGRLQQIYCEKEMISSRVAEGYIFQGREVLEDGTVQLTFGQL